MLSPALVVAGRLGALWLVDASLRSLSSSPHDLLPVHMSVSRFPLCIRILVPLD